ncbi:MAG: succinylglutamate desuccinylase/aspartoacylase family protein [Bacteroidota bacterium]|nr:succinylglutamate desuccinylase/aspartoacylase family protein [Bacteroidota bacterium]
MNSKSKIRITGYVLLLFSTLIFYTDAVSQEIFRVGEVETIQGEKKSGYIIVPGGEDSGEVKVPITVVNGKKSGPVLALIAGVHGYEYPPILAMTRLSMELDSKTRGLAVNFNLKVIVHETGRTKDIEKSMYVSNTALLRGKPAISTEVGKLGQTDESDDLEVMRGNYNIMKHLDMIKGEPDIRFESVWVEEYQIIRSEHSEGLFYPLVSRGDHIQKDQLVGYLTDYFGNRLQDVKSPYDGIVLYIIATPPMSEGEPMAMIGKF